MTKVDVEGGKYTFVVDGGSVVIQRFRQDWVACGPSGAKAIIALICEHEEALRKLARYREALAKYPLDHA